MAERTPCPFVKSPFDDCHVSSMNSASIGEAVYYCGGNFRECEIFKKYAELDRNRDKEMSVEILSIPGKGGKP